ncbi:MAG: type 4a pilus biogenesis protein PilO, partial [Candidatus Krumholzibacteria bacterium]|nr:type 4a pilus biogenesis protein PilO [Candidatus Krumholzibacteria bacterium]
NFHQVGIFLSRLANMPRIVNVSKLEIDTYDAPRKKAKGQKGESRGKRMSTVEAEFTMSAYTLLGGVTNEEIQVD